MRIDGSKNKPAAGGNTCRRQKNILPQLCGTIKP
jgi:hypothetical protein